MNAEELVRTAMNPVRMRIVQYLITHGEGTAGAIGEELEDVPKASLYRHLRVMLEAGLVRVAEERKVRGTVEKTYAIVEQPVEKDDRQSVGQMVNMLLLQLSARFNSYIEREDADPAKDMAGVSTCTLLLSDDELREVTEGIGKLISRHLNNKPGKGRKARSISFMILPAGEE